MKKFLDMKKYNRVSAFFAVKGFAVKELEIPAVISILIIREAACE